MTETGFFFSCSCKGWVRDLRICAIGTPPGPGRPVCLAAHMPSISHVSPKKKKNPVSEACRYKYVCTCGSGRSRASSSSYRRALELPCCEWPPPVHRLLRYPSTYYKYASPATSHQSCTLEYASRTVTHSDRDSDMPDRRCAYDSIGKASSALCAQ